LLVVEQVEGELQQQALQLLVVVVVGMR